MFSKTRKKEINLNALRLNETISVLFMNEKVKLRNGISLVARFLEIPWFYIVL